MLDRLHNYISKWNFRKYRVNEVNNEVGQLLSFGKIILPSAVRKKWHIEKRFYGKRISQIRRCIFGHRSTVTCTTKMSRYLESNKHKRYDTLQWDVKVCNIYMHGGYTKEHNIIKLCVAYEVKANKREKKDQVHCAKWYCHSRRWLNRMHCN